jgi:hypothetical protein
MSTFLTAACFRSICFAVIFIASNVGSQRLAGASPSVVVAPLDGNANARTKQAIASAIIDFGNRNGFSATAGEVSMSDATAAVGCNASDSECSQSVRTTLGAEQLVFGQASGSNPLTVKLTIVDDQGARTANASIVSNTTIESDLAPALTSLFAIKKSSDVSPTSPTIEPAKTEPAINKIATQSIDTPTTFSNTQVEPPTRQPRLKLAGAGLAIGAVTTVGGLLLWSKASGIQDDIDSAPVRNINDIRNLQALEERGDTASLWGNVLVFTGATVAGISGYILYKDWKSKKNSPAVSVYPGLIQHGFTVVVRVGGNP